MPDADFPIIPSKTAMLFFDTYNRALHPADKDAQAPLLPTIERMARINQASRAAGIRVFYAQADHRPDNKDFFSHIVDRLAGKPPEQGPYRTISPGVASGQWEVQVIDEIAPQPEDYVIKKHRWSSFHQTWLELALRNAGIDTIMLAGGAIQVGIASTAYSARDLGYHQVFLTDAITPVSGNMRDVFLNEVFPGFGRVRTVEQAIALFQKG